jgi:hypothetical protein
MRNNFSIHGTKKSYIRNKTIESKEQVETKKNPKKKKNQKTQE